MTAFIIITSKHVANLEAKKIRQNNQEKKENELSGGDGG
jgi:hypothetical protein